MFLVPIYKNKTDILFLLTKSKRCLVRQLWEGCLKEAHMKQSNKNQLGFVPKRSIVNIIYQAGMDKCRENKDVYM